jgi:hypothetical protein
MPTIDADSHIFESAHAWDYISARDQAHKPILVMTERVDEEKLRLAGSNTLARPSRWLIGGQAYAALTVDAQGYPKGAQTLDNPDGRITHMDALGIDVQVIYPTLFFGFIVDSAATELILVQSYHRWMADVCAPRRKKTALDCTHFSKKPRGLGGVVRGRA